MHEIYADPKRLKAANSMNGKIGKKKKLYSVTFEPGKITPVEDDVYDALMAEESGVFAFLLDDNALIEKKPGEEGSKQEIPDPVKEAENALMAVEDELSAAKDADAKKAIMKEVKAAKKALTAAKNKAKSKSQD